MAGKMSIYALSMAMACAVASANVDMNCNTVTADLTAGFFAGDTTTCEASGDYECCSSADCDNDNLFCNQNDRTNDNASIHTCINKYSVDQGCTWNDDCYSGICATGDDSSFQCGECSYDTDCESTQYCNVVEPTENYWKCVSKKNAGAACLNANECASNWCSCEEGTAGYCLDENVAVEDLGIQDAECENTNECGDGLYCNLYDSSNNLNTCQPTVAIGQQCEEDEVCESGMCHRNTCGTCQSQADCAYGDGEYCAWRTFNGDSYFECGAPIAVGEPCYFNFECINLACGEEGGDADSPSDGEARNNVCL